MTRERGYLAVAGVAVLAAILLFFCMLSFNTRPMSLETTPRETSPREGVSPETAYAAENKSPTTDESQSPPTVADPEPAKRKTATVSGSITDAGYEEPIENAAVRFCARDDSEQNRIETTTDADGKYSIQVPAGAEFSIHFSKQFFDAVESEIMVLDSGVEYELDIVMVEYPYVDLKINVTDATTGIPLKDFSLEFVGERGQKPGGFWWIYGFNCCDIRIKPSNGVFFESYILSVEKLGYRIYTSDEIVPVDREHELNIALEPCRTTLSGIVTDSDTGIPMPGVSVYLNGRDMYQILDFEGYSAREVSDYAGRFSFDVFATNPHQLSCIHPGYDWFDKVDIEAIEGEDVTFNIELVSLSGRICVGVFDAKTGNPLSDALVYFDAEARDSPEGNTDSEGVIESFNFRRGNSRFEVRNEGYLDAIVSVENITAEKTKYVEVYLRPLDALIRGRFFDVVTGRVPGIDSLPWLICYISDEDNFDICSRRLHFKVSEDGTYSYRVPSGELELSYSGGGEYLDSEDITILINAGEEVEIDFALEPMPECVARVLVRSVFIEDGTLAKRAMVDVLYKNTWLDTDETKDGLVTADVPSGEITIESLIYGRYGLTYKGCVKVFISPGETKEVTVKLERVEGE